MYDECTKAKKNYRVRDFIRALAYIWSFPGETKAAFYQRLLRLEQGLLSASSSASSEARSGVNVHVAARRRAPG